MMRGRRRGRRRQGGRGGRAFDGGDGDEKLSISISSGDGHGGFFSAHQTTPFSRTERETQNTKRKTSFLKILFSVVVSFGEFKASIHINLVCAFFFIYLFIFSFLKYVLILSVFSKHSM